jgi:hypothetical protein
MIYVFEADPSSTRDAGAIVGDTESVETFKRNALSLALGAAAASELNTNKLNGIVTELANSNRISIKYWRDFLGVVYDISRNSQLRKDQLVEAAIRGNITTGAMLEEVEDIERVYRKDMLADHWIKSDGTIAFPGDGQLETHVGTLDNYFEPDSDKQAVVEAVSATHFVYHSGLKDADISWTVATGETPTVYEHVMLGALDDHEGFAPVATVLDDDYLEALHRRAELNE